MSHIITTSQRESLTRALVRRFGGRAEDLRFVALDDYTRRVENDATGCSLDADFSTSRMQVIIAHDARAEPARMVPMPAQQQQARDVRAARTSPVTFDSFSPAVRAEALRWADLASDEAPLCGGVHAYDDGMREGVDKLTRRGVISPAVASAILALYDVPAVAIDAATPLARLRARPFVEHLAIIERQAVGDAGAAPCMVPVLCQQQQGQHRPCPVDIGPSVYEAAGMAWIAVRDRLGGLVRRFGPHAPGSLAFEQRLRDEMQAADLHNRMRAPGDTARQLVHVEPR